jgi:phosphoribosylanthranilate isomerase
MRVKICGITELSEAKLCIEVGADALGFLVGITHLAEDKIKPEVAREIIKKIPPFVSTVAVTHLTGALDIIELCKYINASTVQIHNSMSVDDVVLIRSKMPTLKIIKTFHIDNKVRLDVIDSYLGIVDAILLDTRTTERLGGTGLIHDWNVSKEITSKVSMPVILAGGLTPFNLAEAINTVKPLFAVDVNSGVETNAKKDIVKVRDFINIARGTN